ncbi:hypothetical protein ACFL6T_03300 [Candidatus Zixiibacteriota bacterium]
MFASISAKELEKRAFRSTFQDGIWDIYLGLLLLNMGLSVGLAQLLPLKPQHLGAILLVVVIIIMAGFFLGKKYITTPRLGVVKFGADRQKKVQKVRLVLSLSALIGVATFLGFGSLTELFGSLPGWVAPLGLFGVSAIVVFSLGAYYLDYTRAYLYGWCYALAFPFGIFLQESTRFGFLISYGLMSMVMIVPGIILLLRFIREHPIPLEEMTERGVDEGLTSGELTAGGE